MKKNIILLFILITICKICNAQGIYDSELSVNIKIRTNTGEVLENKNVTAIFHFTDNSKNLKNCSGFQFSPHGNDYLNLVKGFSSFINTSRWRNVSEENDNSKLCY